MKKLYAWLCSLIMVFALAVPINAATTDNTNPDGSLAYTGYRPVETDRNSPYFVDQYGNILDTAPAEGTYVEVLYDSRWDDTSTRSANAQVQQYININGIVLRGPSSGYYASSFYNCTMSVGMYIYFDASSLYISSVGSPTILSFYCPCDASGRSAPWASSYASGGRAYATGYVTYRYHTVETLSGTGSWGY